MHRVPRHRPSSAGRPRPVGAARLAAALLLSALAAAGATTAGATAPTERAIVVLNNGSRVEVLRAWQEGETYRLLLPTGGTVVLPAAQVRRVSRNASDLPQGRPGIATAAAGAPLPAGSSGTTVSAADRTPVADVRGSVPVDPEVMRPLAPPSPDTFTTIAPPPLVGRAQTQAGVQPTSATTPETRARGREDLTPRPGQMQKMLKRLSSPGARPIGGAQDR